jgi:hypothetical protein
MHNFALWCLASITLKANEIGLPTSTRTIGEALTNAIKFLMMLIGGLAVIFIVVGALQMVTAAGSPQRFKQGRESVLYAVVGLILAMSAYTVVSFVSGSL